MLCSPPIILPGNAAGIILYGGWFHCVWYQLGLPFCWAILSSPWHLSHNFTLFQHHVLLPFLLQVIMPPTQQTPEGENMLAFCLSLSDFPVSVPSSPQGLGASPLSKSNLSMASPHFTSSIFSDIASQLYLLSSFIPASLLFPSL